MDGEERERNGRRKRKKWMRKDKDEEKGIELIPLKEKGN